MILANVKSKANMHGRIEELMVHVSAEAHANNLKIYQQLVLRHSEAKDLVFNSDGTLKPNAHLGVCCIEVSWGHASPAVIDVKA